MNSDPPRRPELVPGTRVGPYEVVSRIDSGGYADVYKVRHGGCFYALKVARVRADGTPDSEDTLCEKRLMREADCLRLVKAEGVVRLHEVGRWPDAGQGWFYLVLDLVEGAPLNVWRKRAKPSPRQFARTFAQLGRAVHALHECQVFHRDLKSSNVLVSDQGVVTVIDLSVALLAGEQHLTEEGLMPGTRSHMSPEALKHLHADESSLPARFLYRPTADLHAVGYMLYEALAGRPPFDTHRSRYELYEQIKTRVPDQPRDLNPRVPEALAALAMRLLAKQPEQRPQTGLELAEALEAEAARASASWDEPLEVPRWLPPMRGEALGDSVEEWVPRLVPATFPVHDLVPEDAAPSGSRRWARWVMAAGMMVGGGLLLGLAAARTWPARLEVAEQPAAALVAEAGERVSFRDHSAAVLVEPLKLPALLEGMWNQKGEVVHVTTSNPPARSQATVKPESRASPLRRTGLAVAAGICTAWAAACAGNSPRPNGLPADIRCPPKASQPLGVKAIRGQPLVYVHLITINGVPFREHEDLVLCRKRPYDLGCTWVREGPVEAYTAGWKTDLSDDSLPWILPPERHQLWGEARAEGDNFYFVFTRIRLNDGRTFPLCGLAETRENPDWSGKAPYFKIIKREKERILIDAGADEMIIHLLEDF